MEKFKKITYAKTIDPETYTVSGYASTFGWDRDGERFVKGAWDLNNYLKNPVVLWSHDISSLPIAKTISVVEDDHGLKVTAQFNPSDEQSMRIFNLFKNGFLNAFSVGFIRNDYVMEDLGDGSGSKGLAITKAELYEYSAVSVPANPGAIVSREIAEMAIKAISPRVIEEVSTKSMGSQFFVVPAESNQEKKEPSPIDEFVPALKRIQELARIAKASPLDETKKSLITTTMTVLNEMLGTESKEELSEESKTKLLGCLSQFASVVAEAHPEAAQPLVKTISQIEKALPGRSE